MGDSDDEHNRRKREKFHREREDYGRDKDQWRYKKSQQQGSIQQQQYQRNYSRSPGRYHETSPPPQKRVRRDWDSQEYNHSHYNTFSNSQPTYFPEFNHAIKEVEYPTQPPMFSFKAFLAEQDDNITDSEAVSKYKEYKLDFKRSQISEFFLSHKEEEWFKSKYHPDDFPKRREEHKKIIEQRLNIFMELYKDGWLDDVAVEVEKTNKLVRFLDAAVIKMEGGTDADLKILDTELEKKELEDGEERSDVEKSGNSPAPESKEVPVGRTRKDSNSHDSSAASEDPEVKEEAVSSVNEKSSEDQKKSADSAFTPVEPHKMLHKTTSIFLRSLPPSVTKEDVENLCKRYIGFKRVALADPAPERRFLRRGWVTFDSTVNIKNICWEVNNTKSLSCDVGAIVNRELTRRIRPIEGITNCKQVVQSDIRLATTIVRNMDGRWDLWPIEKDSVDEATKDSKATVISGNPLLKGITEYLVEEMSAEEEELLGNCASDLPLKDQNSGDEPVVDDELKKVLDRLILYLRVVHSIDFYNGVEYQLEDSMPNRCGIMHARGPLTTTSQEEINEWIAKFEQKLKPFIEYKEQIDIEAAKKLGLKDREEEAERFVTQNTVKINDDKWLCPLSGKKFKGPEFVRKHIFNKHQSKVEEVKREVDYFNNYLLDPKRPQLPDHPSTRPPSAAANQHYASLVHHFQPRHMWAPPAPVGHSQFAQGYKPRQQAYYNNNNSRRVVNSVKDPREREIVKYDISYPDFDDPNAEY